MTVHYHGTPITPNRVLDSLGGRNFCVSFYRPDQIVQVREIAQLIMFDNGAFSAWRCGVEISWDAYYKWVDHWANKHLDFAVIPDIIDGSESDNDKLLLDWPFGRNFGAPVWHMHESLERLHHLAFSGYKTICFGSSGEFSVVGDASWHKRAQKAFNVITNKFGELPCGVHMLRGLSLAGSIYPFTSYDSTNVARNHNRSLETAVEMVDRIDRKNNPSGWTGRNNVPDTIFDGHKIII